MTATGLMGPSQAYDKARKLYRLMRKGDGWSVLCWRPGLGSWERLQAILPRSQAVQERAGLVTAHALVLLGISQAQVASLLRRHYTGPARKRVAAAYRDER